MRVMCQKKSKKGQKKGKTFENFGRNVQNLKFEKEQVIVCDYRTQSAARKGSGYFLSFFKVKYTKSEFA